MAGLVDNFLLERDPTTWTAPAGFPPALMPAGFFAQEASSGLEVTLVSVSRKPRVSELREGWLKRRGGRSSPVLLVAFYPTAEGQAGFFVRAGGGAAGGASRPRGVTGRTSG